MHDFWRDFNSGGQWTIAETELRCVVKLVSIPCCYFIPNFKLNNGIYKKKKKKTSCQINQLHCTELVAVAVTYGREAFQTQYTLFIIVFPIKFQMWTSVWPIAQLLTRYEVPYFFYLCVSGNIFQSIVLKVHNLHCIKSALAFTMAKYIIVLSYEYTVFQTKSYLTWCQCQVDFDLYTLCASVKRLLCKLYKSEREPNKISPMLNESMYINIS